MLQRAETVLDAVPHGSKKRVCDSRGRAKEGSYAAAPELAGAEVNYHFELIILLYFVSML